MALIPCKACGKPISQDATSCPGCGHPVGSASGAARVGDTMQRTGFSMMKGGCGLLIIVVFVAILIGALAS